MHRHKHIEDLNLIQCFYGSPHFTVKGIFWKILGKGMRSRGLMEHAKRRYVEKTVSKQSVAPEAKKIDRSAAIKDMSEWGAGPLISVIMPVYNIDPRLLVQAIESVRGQIYSNWELCVVDDASTDDAIRTTLMKYAKRDRRIRTHFRQLNGHIACATNDAIDMSKGDWCVFLDHDDVLTEDALYEIVKACRFHRNLVLIYSDEDKIDDTGRTYDAFYKPDFSRELLYGQNYVNHITAIKTDSLKEIGGLRQGYEGSQDHDLLLRLTLSLDHSSIYHIPKILYHWRAAAGSGTFSDREPAQVSDSRRRALADIVEGWGGRVVAGPDGFNRLIRPLPSPEPRVSVIIPTRDRSDLLATTLDGVLNSTNYENLEVIIVDNDSIEPATTALFSRYSTHERVRIVRFTGPFNFSALSNFGASQATGDILLFLNNDIEVIEPDWLTEMVRHSVRSEVGAVGAKLLYGDRTVQHGGVVLGIGGVAGHSHLGFSDDDPGYFSKMTVAHEVSAVTGACMAVRTEVFHEVGGFDTRDLKVAFNDVDLCLLIRQAGYLIIWTPLAKLIHHESQSRGYEDTPEKKARFEREVKIMLARWEYELANDPYYNKNLSREAAYQRSP